jgi:hypothetical protein
VGAHITRRITDRHGDILIYNTQREPIQTTIYTYLHRLPGSHPPDNQFHLHTRRLALTTNKNPNHDEPETPAISPKPAESNQNNPDLAGELTETERRRQQALDPRRQRLAWNARSRSSGGSRRRGAADLT